MILVVGGAGYTASQMVTEEQTPLQSFLLIIKKLEHIGLGNLICGYRRYFENCLKLGNEIRHKVSAK